MFRAVRRFSSKKAAPAPGGGGGGGGTFLFLTLLLGGGVGYVGYACETEPDSALATSVTGTIKTYVPAALPVLDQVRAGIRSSGLLPATKASTPKAASPAPAAPAAPVAAVAVAAAAAAPAPVAASASTSAPVATPAPAVADHLTPAERKARQLRLDAAAELFEEASLQSVALRSEIEKSLLRDLHKLDADALRTRMTQLAAEFFERTKWESLRMHQAMRQVETDVARKYLELMNQQRGELEAETKKALVAKEEQLNAHHAHITALAGTVDGFD